MCRAFRHVIVRLRTTGPSCEDDAVSREWTQCDNDGVASPRDHITRCSVATQRGLCCADEASNQRWQRGCERWRLRSKVKCEEAIKIWVHGVMHGTTVNLQVFSGFYIPFQRFASRKATCALPRRPRTRYRRQTSLDRAFVPSCVLLANPHSPVMPGRSPRSSKARLGTPVGSPRCSIRRPT